jgi:glycosyltransferase involved in cell wall biosynthesis
MPTFNSASYVESTVDTVRAQTFDNWELVLSDDGSSDATVAISDAIAESDDRIISIKGRHAGPAVARQRGLRRSDPRSEFVVFMDSDDTWTPEALTVLVHALESEPESPAAHGLARGTDINGHPFDNDDLANSMRRRYVSRGGQHVQLEAGSRTPYEAMLLKNCVVTPGTTLIRRSALDAVGDLDPSTAPADDWDLLIRLARRNDLIFVDHIVLNWRRHPDSLANTSKRWNWSYLVVRARTIQCRENSSQHRRAALEALLSDCRRSYREMLMGIRRADFHETLRAVVFAVLTSGMYARFQWFSTRRFSSAGARV